MFDITKSVPVTRKEGRNKYPFRLMAIGDSMFVPDAKVGSLPIGYWRLVTGFSLMARTVEENGAKGVRIWRTE
jgi:hypothetical protein